MRILLISDVHANLSALQAVLQAAGPTDAVWNLGDTVGYGPHPVECIAAIAGLDPAVNLAGNHDLACAGGLPLEAFNSVAATAAAWTAARLDTEHKASLMSLRSMTHQEDVLFAHGSPRDPVWEYVDDSHTAGAVFRSAGFRTCFVGHTHRPALARPDPFWRRVRLSPVHDGQEVDLAGSRLLINPGSVGQPRDGDPRAAYAMVDTSRGRLTAHRVEYDVERTRQAMTEAGLPGTLIDRLAIGR